jgi:hypothetical protein
MTLHPAPPREGLTASGAALATAEERNGAGHEVVGGLLGQPDGFEGGGLPERY